MLNNLRYQAAPSDETPAGVLRVDRIISYHLRHTFGSLAVRKAPLSDVQAWMGHRTSAPLSAKLTAAFTGGGDVAVISEGETTVAAN